MRGRWGQGSILTEKEIRRLDREVGVCEGGAHTRAEHTRAEHTRAARTTRACVRACVRAAGLGIRCSGRAQRRHMQPPGFEKRVLCVRARGCVVCSACSCRGW